MASVKRASAARVLRPLARGLGFAAIAAMAGCSADVTRFGLFGGDGSSQKAASQAAYAPPGRGYSSGGGDRSSISETSLTPLAAPSEYRVVGRAPPGAAAGPASGSRPVWPAKADDRPAATWSNGTPPWTDADPFPALDSAAARRKFGSTAEQPPSAWHSHYTMKAGDTLPAVAQRHKVSLDDLKRANGITDLSQARPGTILTVPDRVAAAASAPAATPPRVVQVAPRIAATPAPGPAAEAESARPVPVQRTAARQEETMNDAGPQAAGGKFRWPARGRIISGFGSQTDGSKSDGINLAVPMGTEIHAAEAGRVHYVGNGLKGYGNLVLIRHANGWASTYAHADQVLVKVGDEVKRGQVIGKAGKTGPVAQPQLRFELRKNSVPVDPVPQLAN